MNTETVANALQSIDELEQKFGHEKIKFEQVTADLIKVRLKFSEQASAEIHLQGAHLTRWIDRLGRDNIFTSANAIYKLAVPIRGGNPIIFPQFGPGEMCQHGFARNSIWQVVESKITADATVISLELKPDDVAENYRTQWPHDFVLTLVVSLGESLVTQMKVHNPNDYALSFTLGFHTYLAVDDINSTEIRGLSGLDYMDNLRERAIFHENQNPVVISDFIDRRYQDIPAAIKIHDASSGRLIVMQTKNCHDAFVWNPWQDAGAKLVDLEPQAYQKFVCVEPGNMKTAVILAAGQEFSAEQEIKRLD